VTLLGYEWRKLFRLPALWGFLLLCLGFNWALLGSVSGERELFNRISAVTEELGQRADSRFREGLAARPEDALRDALLEAASGMENIYERYDISALSRFYQETVEKSPLAVRWVTWKYQLLESRIEQLSQSGASMDFYAGPIYNLTHDSFQFLFGTLTRALLLEAALTGMLAVLYLLGYEDSRRTAQLIYASRTGRRLRRTKVLAGLTAALFLYALLALLTLLPYFLLWDYGGVWEANVSSQFNYWTDMLYRRPFLTWTGFTVGGYLAATLTLGGALTAVFCLLAALCGTLVKNTYLAALTLALFLLGGLTASAFCASAGLWPLYFLLGFLPGQLWLCAGGWFTELGLSALLPWQETISAGLNLAVFGIGTALALRRLERKDVL